MSRQLVTCIGNKRGLLDFVGAAVDRVRRRLGGRRLAVADLFSGSGVVARYLKAHADVLWVNDLQPFAALVARCHLTNRSELPEGLAERVAAVEAAKLRTDLGEGFVARHYAPRDDDHIRPGERAFYTRRNAHILDNLRRTIALEVPADQAHLFLGPLLAEASVHANTAGVFKGFYKDPATGVGQFGGGGRDALRRILGEVHLEPPVLSAFEVEVHVRCGDAAALVPELPELDLAYLDPPYNQHPYGSNYFMLDLLASGDAPDPAALSPVAGIPRGWRRSAYNQRGRAAAALEALVSALPARFLLVSYSDEGFLDVGTLVGLLGAHGSVELLERDHPAFRGSRNLRARRARVVERLFLVERR